MGIGIHNSEHHVNVVTFELSQFRLSKLHNLLASQPMIVVSVLLVVLGVITGFLLICFLLGVNFIKNIERLAPICLNMALVT